MSPGGMRYNLDQIKIQQRLRTFRICGAYLAHVLIKKYLSIFSIECDTADAACMRSAYQTHSLDTANLHQSDRQQA